MRAVFTDFRGSGRARRLLGCPIGEVARQMSPHSFACSRPGAQYFSTQSLGARGLKSRAAVFRPVPAVYKAVREGVQVLTEAPRFAIIGQMLDSVDVI